MSHDDTAAVARKPPRRFRGNVLAVLEQRLAGLIGIRQRRCIHVDDHLVTLACGAGIEVVVECGFGDHPERVGLLLAHGRRIARRVVHMRLRVQTVAGGRERLSEQILIRA